MDNDQHQRAHLATLLISAKISTGFNSDKADSLIPEMVKLAGHIQREVRVSDDLEKRWRPRSRPTADEAPPHLLRNERPVQAQLRRARRRRSGGAVTAPGMSHFDTSASSRRASS